MDPVPPMPPVPPVPNPEDVRVLNERMAAAVCPACSSEASFADAGAYYLYQQAGGMGASVNGRACTRCGYLALFLG